MAFVTLNGYDVEHASSLLVYDNLFPEIQHINGKGVTDKYTKTSDVESVTLIDVMRVLPYAPRFRKLGSANNGTWHNQKNVGGYANAPQSQHYTIPVDLYYDEGVPITSPQTYSNPVNLRSVVMAQLVKTAGMSINIITFAKQYEAFFRDSFSDTATADEIASAIFVYTEGNAANVAGSAVDAFIAANSELTNGVPEIGALQIPLEERQSFITPKFDRIMKRQYQTNASEAAAQILANGFINPFTDSEGVRINSATGLAGMYDGVTMFLFNKVTREWVYLALGIARNESTLKSEITTGEGLSALTVNKSTFETKVSKVTDTYEFVYAETGETWKLGTTAVTLADYGISVTGTPADADKITIDYYAVNLYATMLDRLDAMIVYGAGTVRGIVGPSVEVNPNPYLGGIYILPKLKVGVEILHGKTIKFISNTTWTADEVADVRDNIEFTPIDGVTVTGSSLFGSSIFNDGTKS